MCVIFLSQLFVYVLLPFLPPGLFLASQPKVFPCGMFNAVWTLTCRFALAPLITALSSLAFGLRGTMLHIATVQVRVVLGRCERDVTARRYAHNLKCTL